MQRELGGGGCDVPTQIGDEVATGPGTDVGRIGQKLMKTGSDPLTLAPRVTPISAFHLPPNAGYISASMDISRNKRTCISVSDRYVDLMS